MPCTVPLPVPNSGQSMDEMILQRIRELLEQIEGEHRVRILYACESGSRAWGFASPDSDYDIRFLYCRTEGDYLGTGTLPDTIDLPLEGDLDPGGWDLRKALGLLGKSNGALVEWLHSPIVYRESEGFLERWRDAAGRVFSPKLSADHYRGLAKQMVHGKLVGERVRAKDYLYALRAVLAGQWALDGRGLPPVPFADLLGAAPPAVRDEIPALLEWKARSGEAERMERIPVLDDYLSGRISALADQVAALPDAAPEFATLDALARREIRSPRPESAADYTLERVRRADVLLFETVAGSHAYGTAVEGSDRDLRGVFVATRGLLDGLDRVEQVADARNDEVYYELGRFVDLLLKNNPNALELLASPEDCVRFRHPLFAKLDAALFLSRLCEKTFGEYAMGQIRKARGLNKKIVNPQPRERRPLLSFCHVVDGQGSLPLGEWLDQRGIPEGECGLSAVKNAPGLYGVYHSKEESYRGLVSPKDPDALVCSSVPKEAKPLAWMHCNLDAFKAHCRAHREYWEWVGERNEERFATNALHGRGYDSKNLMHTIRLLEMAGEIAREGLLRVRRPNRERLLEVRSGNRRYEDLVAEAEALHADLAPPFAASDLPDEPDRARVQALLVELRAEFR